LNDVGIGHEGGGVKVVGHIASEREHGCSVIANNLDQVLEALLDEVVLAVNQRDDRVRGVSSARSMRSGFKANAGPLRRVRMIMASVLGLVLGNLSVVSPVSASIGQSASDLRESTVGYCV